MHEQLQAFYAIQYSYGYSDLCFRQYGFIHALKILLPLWANQFHILKIHRGVCTYARPSFMQTCTCMAVSRVFRFVTYWQTVIKNSSIFSQLYMFMKFAKKITAEISDYTGH